MVFADWIAAAVLPFELRRSRPRRSSYFDTASFGRGLSVFDFEIFAADLDLDSRVAAFGFSRALYFFYVVTFLALFEREVLVTVLDLAGDFDEDFLAGGIFTVADFTTDGLTLANSFAALALEIEALAAIASGAITA